LYVAHVTLTVNKKGAGTFGLAGASICARIIAWLRYVTAAVIPVPRASTEACSCALTAPGAKGVYWAGVGSAVGVTAAGLLGRCTE
jgi:hypothetical protein